MYSYAETSGFGFSWLLAIVPFNIGPKYEFVSGLVQNSPKQEPHSRSNTIFDARTILHGSYCQMYSCVELSGFDLSSII